ncbi:hypothetical protein D1R32_gp056 [Tunisvirus fontaine2]|uniref:MORN repeat-containing protein n=1 Tax=Tunisvirus fontaine2 TaxID=1421067 RepID=V9SD24_9VIRU|nr:hypothetical protein D1R32_gp056 [Tunisvirus fontaine2]AHC54773.1 hypothetical protein TNS_ORF55 [Tunisvirus fontaine2]
MQKFLDKREVLPFSFIEKPRKRDFVLAKIKNGKKGLVKYQVLPDGTKHGNYSSVNGSQVETKEYYKGVLSGPWTLRNEKAEISGTFVCGKLFGTVKTSGVLVCDVFLVYDERGLPLCCNSKMMCSRFKWDLEAKLLIVTKTFPYGFVHTHFFSDIVFAKARGDNITKKKHLYAFDCFEGVLLANGSSLVYGTTENGARVTINFPVYV